MTRKALEQKAYEALHPATTFEEKLERLHNYKKDIEHIRGLSYGELYEIAYAK